MTDSIFLFACWVVLQLLSTNLAPFMTTPWACLYPVLKKYYKQREKENKTGHASHHRRPLLPAARHFVAGANHPVVFATPFSLF
ncbi:hypothetical protein F4803DRAFT_503147 [Xylaria telfairii]|nr:hypothetical protein F4803DRAFT_503147 [Xylaria telfairii]